MRRVALVIHPTRPVNRARETIERWAAAQGLELVKLEGTAAPGDLVIALGGDGTVLAALRAAAPVAAPVLGVACGSLGALTAVTADRLAAALARVGAGEWDARRLPVLAVEPGDWAINDFVVVRRGATQVLVDVSVDDEPYASLAGDGVVVATPLGSSAYSMAAGGPLLAAGTAAFVCTPLAMHGGNAPPLVVPASATLHLQIQGGYGGFEVEIDGRRRSPDADAYRLSMQEGKAELMAFDGLGLGLADLRSRGLIADSPRVMARRSRA